MIQTLTVIIPHRNHSAFLGASLKAITGQTKPTESILVVDDASDQIEKERFLSMKEDYPSVNFECNRKQVGVNAIVNSHLKTCQTEFIYFAAADDLILPMFFERNLDGLSKYTKAAFSSSLSYLMDEHGMTVPNPYLPPIPLRTTYIDQKKGRSAILKYGGFITGNTVIYRARALREIGGFRNSLQAYSDGFAVLLLSLLFGSVFIPRKMAYWRRTGQNYSVKSYQNVENVENIINEVRTIMTNEYSNIFDRKMRTRWEDRWRYNAASIILPTIRDGRYEPILRLIGLDKRHTRNLFLAIWSALGYRTEIFRFMAFFALRPYDVFCEALWKPVNHFRAIQ